jgi:hypothetical protein
MDWACNMTESDEKAQRNIIRRIEMIMLLGNPRRKWESVKWF